MDLSSIFTFVLGLTYISYIIYRANQEKIAGLSRGLLRGLLYSVALLSFLYGLFILQVPFVASAREAGLPDIEVGGAAANFILTTALSLMSVGIVSSQNLRERIRGLLPETATYDPESPVHTTAWVLVFGLICMVIGNFVAGGGIAGLAENLAEGGIGVGDILFENTLWVFAAALGVGLFSRRTPGEVLARLGLRLPTPQDFNWGIGVGALLFGCVIVIGVVWSAVVSPEELQQQTAASNQLAQSFNSLALALAISVIVAVGEEIFFRGALQPVLGIIPTSLIFAALHTQYTLTPATLMIIITALGMGWLRNRHSTTAAIIGHFVYNFIQLAITVLVSSSLPGA